MMEEIRFDADGLVGIVRRVSYGSSYANYMGRDGHYCGYVCFSEQPVKEAGYNGILTYVPVHGGITYMQFEEGNGFVYGFDCGHAGDNRNPKTDDVEWVKAQCKLMKRGIELAAKYEDDYLSAETNEERADAIDRYLAELGEHLDVKNNFGVMLNLFAGKL